MRQSQRSVLISIVALLCWTAPASRCEQAEVEERLFESELDGVLKLKDYVAKIGGLQALELEAEIIIYPSIPDGDEVADLTEIRADYRFAGDGSRYLFDIDYDDRSEEYGASDSAMTFDGNRGQYLDGATRLLSIGSQIKPTAVTTLRNPILAGLEFLSGTNDDDPFKGFYLSDISNIDKVWDAWESVVVRSRDDGAEAFVVEISTGRLRAGRPQDFRIRLERRNGEFVPVSCEEYIGQDISMRSTVTRFESFEGVGNVPVENRVESFINNKLDAVMEISTTSFEAYESADEINPALFSLLSRDYRGIFDDDIGQFTEHEKFFQRDVAGLVAESAGGNAELDDIAESRASSALASGSSQSDSARTTVSRSTRQAPRSIAQSPFIILGGLFLVAVSLSLAAWFVMRLTRSASVAGNEGASSP